MPLLLGMAMRLQQRQNYADNAHIYANICKYASKRNDLHRCAAAIFGALPSLVVIEMYLKYETWNCEFLKMLLIKRQLILWHCYHMF